MNHLKLSFLALLFGLTTACASIDPYRNSAETSLATAGWTQQDTSMAADNIVNKLVNGKKLAGYIQRRPNQETTLYLAQLENKTDEADLDAARVALNAALKDKLVNEAEGFNVIDPENKAIAKELTRQRSGAVDLNNIVNAAKQSGADTLITGIISGDRHDIGNKTYQDYVFDVQVLEVKTSRVLSTANYKVSKQQKAAKISW